MPNRVSAAVGVAALLLGLGLATPVFADEPEAPEEGATSVIESIVPEAVAEAAPTQSDSDNAATYTSEFVTTEVSRDAEEGVTLSGPDGDLGLSLPFAEDASEADTGSGLPEFDNGNGSTTVPIVHHDASVQVITVIEDPEAPTRYDYTITLPEGAALAPREGGVILLTGQDGGFLGAIAPAWARDANGDPVTTHYEIDGNVLTQVVGHDAATAYPVVADPWLGIQLFSGFYRGTWNGDYTYNANVTPLGAVILGGGGGVGGYVAGQAVFRTSGWDEWKSVWPAVTNKATIQQQYECHVTASVYGCPSPARITSSERA